MNNYVIKPYDDALEEILKYGEDKSNKRTGTKTKYINGILKKYDLRSSFPLVTGRKMFPKSIWAELIWFLSGSTNNNDLNALGAKIWNAWVDSEFENKHGYGPGSFGPVYGFQLRHFGGEYGNGIGGIRGSNLPKFVENDGTSYSVYGMGGFDQLQMMINRLKEDSSCRRILFSLWNPKDTSKQKLPPCHYSYQVTVNDNGELRGSLTQRSADYPIGIPANIQFYSALTMMFAQQTGFKAVEFSHYTVDSHIYYDQIPAVEEYLASKKYDCPKLEINKADDIFSYKVSDFKLSSYESGPKIEIPVAV